MPYAPWIAAIIGLLIGWLVRRELAMRERRETQAMWEAQLRRIESQRDQRKTHVEAKEVRIAKLESEIQRYGNDLDQLRRKVAERELELRDLEEASRHHQEAHRQTSRRVLELHDRNEALEKERDRYQQRSIGLESENLLFREMVSTAEIALLERERTIEELKSRPRSVPLDPSISRDRARKGSPLTTIDPLLELLDLEEDFTPRGTPIPRLEERGESSHVGEVGEEEVVHEDTRPVSTPGAGPDDLTQIKGIGPAFARRLEANGITRFSQIAHWTDRDLERVARTLKVPPSRIRKSGWIESARALIS